jgi:hypothetical protein
VRRARHARGARRQPARRQPARRQRGRRQPGRRRPGRRASGREGSAVRGRDGLFGWRISGRVRRRSACRRNSGSRMKQRRRRRRRRRRSDAEPPPRYPQADGGGQDLTPGRVRRRHVGHRRDGNVQAGEFGRIRARLVRTRFAGRGHYVPGGPPPVGIDVPGRNLRRGRDRGHGTAEHTSRARINRNAQLRPGYYRARWEDSGRQRN